MLNQLLPRLVESTSSSQRCILAAHQNMGGLERLRLEKFLMLPLPESKTPCSALPQQSRIIEVVESGKPTTPDSLDSILGLSEIHCVPMKTASSGELGAAKELNETIPSSSGPLKRPSDNKKDALWKPLLRFFRRFLKRFTQATVYKNVMKMQGSLSEEA